MPNYSALNRALENTVRKHSPDILFPRYCIIEKINSDTINVSTTIGGDVLLRNMNYIGVPVVGEEAILMPIDNNFNKSIIICENFTVTYENEIKNQIENILNEEYITKLKDEIKNEILNNI